jgi:predicted dienelactone hydrolase
MQDDCHSMMWLGYFLAARGYIVAAVNHHGDSIAEGSVLPQAFLLRAERARDLTCVVDKLLAFPMFGQHIDTKRIGAAGHSSGGETVVAIAGGVFDGKHLGEFCNARPSSLTCQPRADSLASLAKLDELKKTDPVVQESVSHEHDALKDPRIKGVLAMAPAVGEAYTRGGSRRSMYP